MKLSSRLPTTAKKVFEGVIYNIYQWQQELFDGSFTTFEMAKKVDAVSIIPVIGEELVILNELQPRDELRISFPGGMIDDGETPLQAAQRELFEETGMRFKNLKLVTIDDLGSTKLDWWVYRFVATDLMEQGNAKQNPGEQIISKIVSFDEAKELSRGNKFMSLSVMDQVDNLQELLALPEITLS